LGVALVPESFRHNLKVVGCEYRDISSPAAHADLIALWRHSNVSPALKRFTQHLKRSVHGKAGADSK
jgi:hypothetical protein